jgi:hypothetical protein
VLFQNPDDLFFRKPFALHALVLVLGQSELQTGLSPRGKVTITKFAARPTETNCEKRRDMLGHPLAEVARSLARATKKSCQTDTLACLSSLTPNHETEQMPDKRQVQDAWHWLLMPKAINLSS